MGNNLIRDLFPVGADDDEVLEFLQRHYGSARSTPDNDVVYPNTERFALWVRCKSGKIKAIEAGSGFSNEELKILKAKVASELVASPATKIERAILFSSHPVKGCYRSGVRLQVGEAPESAPKPPVVKADHPFVLEFPLRQSSDEFITVQRRSRQTLEWTWFLNAVLRTRIKAVGPRASYYWVASFSGKRAPTQADVIWGQEFYTIDGFKTQGDEFSACDEPHIATIPAEEYYATAVYRWEELVVPDNLDEMINAFANLTPENRFRFFKGLSVGVRWLCALGHPCFFFLYRISCRHRVATSRGPCFGKVSEVRSRHGTRPYATVP